MAMEGIGSGNRRGHGIHIPNATATPRDPASGAASARKASLGQGMILKMDTKKPTTVPGRWVASFGSEPSAYWGTVTVKTIDLLKVLNDTTVILDLERRGEDVTLSQRVALQII